MEDCEKQFGEFHVCSNLIMFIFINNRVITMTVWSGNYVNYWKLSGKVGLIWK